MNLQEISRILVVRTDKIGDVTLTTPAIAALRKKYPNAQITGLVSTVAADIYHGNPHLNKVMVLENTYSGFMGYFRLVGELRKINADIAIVFQSKLRVASALWLARIRYRIGPLSKWWSWLFFNLGRRQNRSAVEMHEADYNIQLLRKLGILVAETHEHSYLEVKPEAKIAALRFFQEKGFKKYKTVAIHPGMAGSALNWPESHFTQLGQRLSKRYNVLITGGPTEAALVDRVFQNILKSRTYTPDQPVCASYIGNHGLAEMIAILDQCDGVVAPSTGPMHIATALGKKVISVFPPIKVQSAVRWGPYGVSMGTKLGVSIQDQASVLVPDVNCAENFKCALSACIYYPCMPRIAVEDVETQLLVLLEASSVSMFKSSSFTGYELDDNYEELE